MHLFKTVRFFFDKNIYLWKFNTVVTLQQKKIINNMQSMTFYKYVLNIFYRILLAVLI